MLSVPAEGASQLEGRRRVPAAKVEVRSVPKPRFGLPVHGAIFDSELVTVVVDTIADLGFPRVHESICVVAVPTNCNGIGVRREAGLNRRGVVPIAVRVCIGVPGPGRAGVQGRVVIVHQGVAVIVDPVADFGRTGVHVWVRIVAVTTLGHSPGGCVARRRGGACSAVAVEVGVCIPDGGIQGAGIIHGTVTVVVDAIADFGGTGVHIGVGIVAVVAAFGRVDVSVTVGVGGHGATVGATVIRTAIPISTATVVSTPHQRHDQHRTRPHGSSTTIGR